LQNSTQSNPPPSPAQSFEVNVFQSASSQQSGGNKKNKGKSKKNSNQQEKTKTQNTTVDDKTKKKSKFPFLICAEYHYMKYCPCHDEVNFFLKGTSLLAILTDPFPPQQQQMIDPDFMRRMK
jgi:hypothetical protein